MSGHNESLGLLSVQFVDMRNRTFNKVQELWDRGWAKRRLFCLDCTTDPVYLLQALNAMPKSPELPAFCKFSYFVMFQCVCAIAISCLLISFFHMNVNIDQPDWVKVRLFTNLFLINKSNSTLCETKENQTVCDHSSQVFMTQTKFSFNKTIGNIETLVINLNLGNCS